MFFYLRGRLTSIFCFGAIRNSMVRYLRDKLSSVNGSSYNEPEDLYGAAVLCYV